MKKDIATSERYFIDKDSQRIKELRESSFGSQAVFFSRPVAFRHFLTKGLALSAIMILAKLYISAW
jgi:hypothetical protein